MKAWLSFARHNGWLKLLGRSGGGLRRRVRDRFTARHLRAPGFRVGRDPRLLGLSHMSIGPEFHAGDALWMEAVLRYGEGATMTHFSPNLTVGRSARLSDNVHIACLNEVSIGDHLLCGSRVLISDHAHGRYRGPDASDPAVPPAQRQLSSSAPVRIGHNVWLGDGAAILAGAVLGDGCVIGANSVVNGEVPPGTMAVGAPARAIRVWDTEMRTWRSLVSPGRDGVTGSAG